MTPIELLIVAGGCIVLAVFSGWVLYSEQRTRRANPTNPYALPQRTESAREAMRARAWGDPDHSLADQSRRGRR